MKAQLLLSYRDRERAGGGFQGRRLIVVSVEGAEGPVEAGMVRVAPKRGLMAVSSTGGRGGSRQRIAFGETGGAHAGGEREPGKGLELVIDVEGFEIGGGTLGIGEGWISAAVVEDGAEELVVALVEAEESSLQIVVFVVGGEGGLAADVGGGAVFGGGDGNVVGIRWSSRRCCSGRRARLWSEDGN